MPPGPPGPEASLPRAQLLSIWTAQFVEAVHTTMPYSVAVYMVRDLLGGRGAAALDESVVGWKTGILAASFSFAQFLTSLAWGKVSDSIGRRPVVCISAIASGTSAVAFGLSPTYALACWARLVGGSLNATFGALKSIIAEACAAAGAGQTRPMSLLALAWGMGTIVGPALGALASPCGVGGSAAPPPSLLARAWPAGCAAPGGLWVRHPFLPPCLVAAAFSAAALLVSAFVLEETLPSAVAARARAARGAGLGDARASSSLARAVTALRSRLLGGPRSTLTSPYIGSAAVEEHHGRRAVEMAAPAHRPQPPTPHKVVEDERAALLPHQPTPRKAAAGAAAAAAAAPAVPPSAFAGGGEPKAEAALPPPPPPALPTPAPQYASPWYRSRPVLCALAGYGSTAALFNVVDELLPIFASAPLAGGGLGLSPSQLAGALAVGGVALIVVAQWGYRAAHARLGTLGCARAGLGGAAPLCLALPLPSLLPAAAPAALRLVSLSALLAVRSLVANLAFTAAMLSINVAAPPGTVGVVNGAGQTLASFVRAAGPAAGGALWGAASLVRPGGQVIPFALVAAGMAASARIFRHVTPPPDEVARFHSSGGRRPSAHADEEAGGGSTSSDGGGGRIPALWAPAGGMDDGGAWDDGGVGGGSQLVGLVAPPPPPPPDPAAPLRP